MAGLRVTVKLSTAITLIILLPAFVFHGGIVATLSSTFVHNGAAEFLLTGVSSLIIYDMLLFIE